MSENMCDEILFKDYYKAENTDDEENNNDLLAQLYAEIYYPSNHEIELGANILSNAVPLSNCIVTELNKQENIQHRFNKKGISELEVTRGQEEPVAKVSTQTNKNNLANQEIDNTAEKKKSKKNSSKKHNSPKLLKNKHREKSQKENIVSSDESDMDSKYNVLQKNMKQEKLMSRKRQNETSEDSDSESVLEVPLPPKPKPLLINLRDSDDEDAGSSIDEDDLLEGRLHDKNAFKNSSGVFNFRASSSSSSSSPEVEIIEVMPNRQDTIAISNTADESSQNNNISVTTNDKSTRAHEFNDDIVLNCTIIQKGARSIDEIKQLSKSVEQNKIGTSPEDTSKYSKKRSSQNTPRDDRADDTCTFQEPWTSPDRGEKSEKQTKKTRQNTNINETDKNIRDNIKYNLKNKVQSVEDTSLEMSYGINNDPVVSRKRHSEGNNGEGGEDGVAENNSPVQKRQCTVQQSDQLNVASTSQSSGKRIRNPIISDFHKLPKLGSYWTKFFVPLPEVVKNFYNDSRGQNFYNDSRGQNFYNDPRGQNFSNDSLGQNFDIHELQSGMSKDPKLWAILDEDLMPCPAIKRGRYWSRCSSCQRDGHQRKDCPEQRAKVECCHMCGVRGHVTWRCPQRQCLTCGKKQDTYRKTCEYCRTLYCTMCCSVGHKKEYCPDLWRRYHQVTREVSRLPRNPGNVMKPASQLHCCNCSKRGHEFSTCNEYRWSAHFRTSPFVTNYTEGPCYELEIGPERTPVIDKTVEILPYRLKNKGTLNQQIQEDMSVAEVQAEPFPDVNAPSSSTSAQTNEKVYTQEYPEEQVMMISEATVLNFANVIYCCGNYRNKKDSDARVLVSNLSQHKTLSSAGKNFVQSKFSNGTVIPAFLRKLRKAAHFEMTIGLLASKSEVMVQLMASKECVCLLFYLLLHWLDLPINEKQHGIDVNLPMQSDLMWHFLTNLDLQRKEIKDPFRLMNVVNIFKHKMLNMPKNKEYFHNQMCMWDAQTKLLTYINTHPEPSSHVRKILSYIEMLKCSENSNHQLDAATYLDILLSYNNIYTPHTPPKLRVTLQRIMEQIQNLEKTSDFTEDQFPSDADANSVSFATSSFYMSQEIDTIANPSTTTNVQDMLHDTSCVIQMNNSDDIYQPGTSNTVKNRMQYPQNISSFHNEPVSIQSINLEREDDKDNGVNMNTNVPATKTSINTTDTNNQSNNQKPPTRKMRNKASTVEQRLLKENLLCKQARKLARQAYAFEIPYMVKAAEDLQRKIKNKTLNKKHLQTMRKMISMESKHRKQIKNCYSHLN
ncbi:PREDICTED: uncharacterized protein LOC106748865 [Dinoponera quadriceps]|uniref:Zinc finger CCHC domain-containing protein 7 n=1 Tax=Dinoponera quadriceps TaxID=609295 RepID=A0A6P3XXK4_DINQU|nr:PREDICTED: uncharacterized protein LOC106748865 [Dinoponera quadriceps]